ncbi:MAG: pentapeptide repeat-containing protein [Haloglomus sp.]
MSNTDEGSREEAVDTEVLHLTPAERAERGVTDAEVRAALLAVARSGDREDKDLRGVELPALDLDRLTVEGADRHPLDLREATIEALSLEFSSVAVPLRLGGATVGDLTVDNATVESGLEAPDVTVTGEVSGFESRFEGDVDFTDADFDGRVDFDEAVFDDDVSFDRAAFDGAVAFRGAEFHGRSNLLEDNTSFTGATFRDRVEFTQAAIGYVHFEDATFEGDAVFEEAVFEGDADFTDAAFRGLADFDETRFREDADFAGVDVRGVADFEGAVFAGGQRALEADLTFEGARFRDEADFRQAKFRGATFVDAAFEGDADFQAAAFEGDADFTGATFAGLADFDEGRFHADAQFPDVRFDGRVDFRGAEFSGGDNYLAESVSFDGTDFVTDADFERAHFTSATFTDTAFGGRINFRETTFADAIDFEATQVDADAYVDFTRAKIRTGRIAQPPDGWVRYDMTLASIGDLSLDAATDAAGRELLDYFRFCRTEFDEFADHEFDFSDHRDYLDRNAWNIHTFAEPPGADVEYALEMTPEVIETTYLKAKQAATEAGDMKVAGEFRVKRQQYSRAKNWEVVRDPTVGAWTRVKNFGRVAENYFLGVTCGHGMRPIRIMIAFLVAPLFYVVPYAFGGPLFRTSAADGAQITSLGQILRPEGLEILFETARFSYISYTTIGYGFIGPEGPAAEVLAASEAYLGVILSALVIYALVKRSEL